MATSSTIKLLSNNPFILLASPLKCFVVHSFNLHSILSLVILKCLEINGLALIISTIASLTSAEISRVFPAVACCANLGLLNIISISVTAQKNDFPAFLPISR